MTDDDDDSSSCLTCCFVGLIIIVTIGIIAYFMEGIVIIGLLLFFGVICYLIYRLSKWRDKKKRQKRTQKRHHPFTQTHNTKPSIVYEGYEEPFDNLSKDNDNREEYNDKHHNFDDDGNDNDSIDGQQQG